MSKSLVSKFQSSISPFGDLEVLKCLNALHKSGAVENLDDTPETLYTIVFKAICDGEYPNLREANLTRIVEDYLEEQGICYEI